MRVGRVLNGMVLAALLTAQAGPAFAADKAAGWAKWTERAESIDAALKSETGDKAALKTACTGVTGTVVSQGFQFPGWGMALIQVCTYTKDNWIYGQSRKGAKRQCSDIKSLVKQLNKATPVPESPRAHEVAISIATTLQDGITRFC